MDFTVLGWAKIDAVSGDQVILGDQPVVSHFSISSLSFLFAPRGFFIRCRADTGEGMYAHESDLLLDSLCN